MSTLHPSPPRHARELAPMRIAMVGPQDERSGIDGVGSTILEIGQRLASRGHGITVDGLPLDRVAATARLDPDLDDRRTRTRSPLQALSRTAVSATRLSMTARHDVVFLFDPASAPFLPVLRRRSTPIAVHAGGPGPRDHFGAGGSRYGRFAERFIARAADAVIADAHSIVDHYEDEFGIAAELIAYGTRVVRDPGTDTIDSLGLQPGGYHLVVARSEPEHHLDVIIEGYHRSDAMMPLVVLGATESSVGVGSIACRDPRIRLLSRISDRFALDQLHAHALTFLHGRSTGGTNPSLLRAMGAGTAVISFDATVNREVAGTAGSYFASPAALARCVEEAERYPFRFRDIGELMQDRVERRYNWDAVTEAYEALATRLVHGYSNRGASTGRRTPSNMAVVPPPGIGVRRA